MKTLTDEELRKLSGLLRQVLDVLSAPEEAEPVVPQEVAARVKELLGLKVCLQCKKKKNERYRSGCCISCYDRSRRLMRLGRVTEKTLLEKGLWTDPTPPGRRAEKTDLDDLLESAKQVNADPTKTGTDDMEAQGNLIQQMSDEGKKGKKKPKGG
jgi:hypothetical protein